MEIKRTEFITPVITLPNGNTTIIGEVNQEFVLNKNELAIIQGRSTGMKALRKRSEEIANIAAQKKVVVGWENRGNHYLVYIKTLANQSIWSEPVFTKGNPTVKKINTFYDIIEEVLGKR